MTEVTTGRSTNQASATWAVKAPRASATDRTASMTRQARSSGCGRNVAPVLAVSQPPPSGDQPRMPIRSLTQAWGELNCEAPLHKRSNAVCK
jgi:hypothetical protein